MYLCQNLVGGSPVTKKKKKKEGGSLVELDYNPIVL